MTMKSMFPEQTNDSAQFRHDEQSISDIEALLEQDIYGNTSPQSLLVKVAARRRRTNAAEARKWSGWPEPLFRIY